MSALDKLYAKRVGQKGSPIQSTEDIKDETRRQAVEELLKEKPQDERPA